MTRGGSAGGVVLETGVFAAAMAELAAIVESKSSIPILQNVLIQSDGAGQLHLTATNLDMQYSMHLPVASGEAMAVTVQAKRLATALATFAKGSQCGFEVADGWMRLRSGRAVMRLPVLAPDDFPLMPDKDEMAIRWMMPGAVLRDALDGVAFAMSVEDTRHFLLGVNLSLYEGRLCFAATDGLRLAVRSLAVPEGADALERAADVILPRKLVLLLRGINEAGDVEVKVVRRRRIVIRFPSGRCIASKLIDADYVDFRRIIPKSMPHQLSLPRDELGEALARVQLMADDKDRTICLTLDAEQARIEARAQDGADVVEELPCTWSGEPGTRIGFNAKQLREQVDKMSGDAIVLHRDGADDAKGKFNMIDGADEGDLYLLSGVRV